MMGFPENYTDLGQSALATPSSPQPLNGLVEGSSNTISGCGVSLTQSGMTFARDLSYEEWENIGFEMARFNKSWQWCIGDWINYGEKKYGETYKAAIEATGLSYGLATTVASVCKEFESSRRRELSFTHNSEVQSLERERQDELLARAEAEQWPASSVRKEVRAIKVSNGEPANDIYEEKKGEEQSASKETNKIGEMVDVIFETFELHEITVLSERIAQRLERAMQ
jgi:hypothetical protein